MGMQEILLMSILMGAIVWAFYRLAKDTTDKA